MKNQLFFSFITVTLVMFVLHIAIADVEFIGEDTETKGNWIDKYGANGAILYAPTDITDLKDIEEYEDSDQRWDWANPTDDERGLQYPDSSDKRADSCILLV